MKHLYKAVFLFIITALLIPTHLLAQDLTIKVRDHERKTLPGATVQLTNMSDSVVRNTISDTKGVATFEKVAEGVYVVRISYIGFEQLEKAITVKPDRYYFDYKLKESTIGLEEFTVTARKPLITQEDDKMIIDPEPMAATSTNTLEVLESTPGLFVDQDGGIYLSSATPAKVYINGREQKMGNQDISTILRNLPPGSVQRIEVLRTPSSKYDAASSGGIINIVLKKGVKFGQFGSLNAGMNQGVYGNRFGGISFNTGSDKSTMYINANYNHNDVLEALNATRYLSSDTALVQAAATRNTSKQFYTGYGISYDATDKLNMSYDGRINASRRTSYGYNNNRIWETDTIRLFESDNNTDSKNDFLSLQQDFGLTYKIDSAGSEWDTKLSYTYNTNGAEQDYTTDYLFPFETRTLGRGNNTQHRHFGILQTDLTYYLPYEFKLETGAKSTFQLYTSTADFTINTNGNWVSDNARTQSFTYREYINAAYAQASRKLWFDMQLKAGLRMEHTLMDGRQKIPSDTSFVVNRADWFPYVYLSRKLFGIMGVQLDGYIIYRRTINRPDYQNLNPYIRIVDQFLYETGNPALKPQFTENIEMNISFDDMPLFAIGRNYTTDIFSSVVYEDPDQAAISVRTYDNLGKNRETYMRGILGIPPGGRYFFAIGAQYNLNEYDGFYDNEPFAYSRGGWRFFTFHALKLFEETRLTMSGFIMHKGQYNFYELGTFGSLNIGLRQTFFDKKLTVMLNARDVLRTMVTEFRLTQGNFDTYGDRYTDNRRFGINIRYNFGIGKKDEKKNFNDYEKED